MEKFSLGKVFTTQKINQVIEKDLTFSIFIQTSIFRHITGDWGDIDEEDANSNEEALELGFRILSVYKLPEPVKRYSGSDEKIWIITEADRSITTILFPSEY